MRFLSRFKALDACGVKHNTNKSSRWTRSNGKVVTSRGLLGRYEFFLREFRRRSPLALLELGAGPDENIGASMRCWKDYFDDTSDLNVADIKPSAMALAKEGFKVHVGDLGDMSFLAKLEAKEWDFILDDASHFWHHQVLAFRRLFPAVKSGGVYIVEDLCTSFGKFRSEYNPDKSPKDACFYFMALSRSACGGKYDEESKLVKPVYNIDATDYAMGKLIDMICWTMNSCIIVKK